MNAKFVCIVNIKMKDYKVYTIVLTSDAWEIHLNDEIPGQQFHLEPRGRWRRKTCTSFFRRGLRTEGLHVEPLGLRTPESMTCYQQLTENPALQPRLAQGAGAKWWEPMGATGHRDTPLLEEEPSDQGEADQELEGVWCSRRRAWSWDAPARRD